MVLPSVNRTITLAFVDWGSKSCIAAEKAAAWLVEPEASSASTASLSAATEGISCVSAVAVWLKLTMPIRLPEPMASGAPPVDSDRMSIKVLAPALTLSIGAPSRLSDRSRVRTMSVGLLTISGEAESARVTCSVPSQSMRSRLTCLLVLVTPMVAPSYARGCQGKEISRPLSYARDGKWVRKRGRLQRRRAQKKRGAPGNPRAPRNPRFCGEKMNPPLGTLTI